MDKFGLCNPTHQAQDMSSLLCDLLRNHTKWKLKFAVLFIQYYFWNIKENTSFTVVYFGMGIFYEREKGGQPKLLFIQFYVLTEALFFVCLNLFL